MAGAPPQQYAAQAERYVQLMGLTGFEKHYPYELSGGMQQRVALARAWISEPELFLMDEPFGALDAQTRSNMQDLLLEVLATERKTVMLITHSVEEAVYLSSRIVVMTAAQDAQQWALEIGADGFLAKPFEFGELVQAVQQHGR